MHFLNRRVRASFAWVVFLFPLIAIGAPQGEKQEPSVWTNLASAFLPIVVIAILLFWWLRRIQAKPAKRTEIYITRHEQHMERVEKALERIAQALEQRHPH